MLSFSALDLYSLCGCVWWWISVSQPHDSTSSCTPAKSRLRKYLVPHKVPRGFNLKSAFALSNPKPTSREGKYAEMTSDQQISILRHWALSGFLSDSCEKPPSQLFPPVVTFKDAKSLSLQPARLRTVSLSRDETGIYQDVFWLCCDEGTRTGCSSLFWLFYGFIHSLYHLTTVSSIKPHFYLLSACDL